MIVEFELNGQKFAGLNAGPAHTFSCACTRPPTPATG
jgi:predicted 3-demethylubiquinone-9 3-methyltransferase (glyoxalase superfamily)